ncbi:MAG: hydrogenase iron-sulfur subunit, partial [Promethearchaeota archaeon]
TAMLDPSLIFEAFFNGADGVLIAGCHEQDCHYDSGFIKAKNRYDSIREFLNSVGISQERIRIESISAGEGKKYAEIIKQFKESLEQLGPIKPEESK